MRFDKAAMVLFSKNVDVRGARSNHVAGEWTEEVDHRGEGPHVHSCDDFDVPREYHPR